MPKSFVFTEITNPTKGLSSISVTTPLIHCFSLVTYGEISTSSPTLKIEEAVLVFFLSNTAGISELLYG